MYLYISVSVCSHVYRAVVYLWLPKDNLWKFILSFDQWVLGIKLWSSGLVAGTLPAEPRCWLLALLGFENTGIGGGECATPHRPD